MATKDVGQLRTRLSWDDNGAKRSMTGFRDDLKGLKSEMNSLKSTGRSYTNSLKGMRQQSDNLNRTFKTQQQQVRELRRRYQESKRVKGEDAKQTKNLARQYNNARAQMRRTAGKLRDVNRAIESQINPWKRLGRSMTTAGTRMQSVGRGMSSAGRKMTMRVTAPLLGIAAAAIKVASDFEESMSEVQAKSGATGDEMEQLRKQARHMGETTRFSAKEAGDGMTFLAQAGFSVQDIMDTMPHMLDLAASSNMDLGQAADIASNILTGFNMKASESGHMADVLAAAAANANTDVEQLGDGMKYVAPVASTLGLKIEGTTAAIEVMSNAGIQGSKAGRSLRQGLLRLAKPTGEAAGLIKKLGINVFDSNGKMKTMPNIVKDINGGLKGLDSKARAAALSTIFGTNSTAGWSKILDAGSDKVKDYTEQLKNSDGAAKDMAETMNDNAKGSMRQFKSAMEEAGIAISETLLPVFTDLVDGATDLIRKFGNMDASTQKTILKMAGLAAAIGPAAIVMGNLTTAAGGLMRAGGGLLSLLGKTGGKGLLGRFAMMAASAGPIGLTIGVVAALAAGFAYFNKKGKETEKVSLDAANAMIETHDKQEKLIDSMDRLRKRSKLTNDEFAEYVDLQARVKKETDPQVIANLKDRMQELQKKSGLSNKQLDNMVGLNKDLTENAPEATGKITEQGNRIADTTENLRKYNKELAKATNRELEIQREVALENQAKLMERKKDIQKDINAGKDEETRLLDVVQGYDQKSVNQAIKKEEKIMAQLQAKHKQTNLNSEEEKQLRDQLIHHQDIINALKDGKGATLDQLTATHDTNNELQKKLGKTQEEIDKLDVVTDKLKENLQVSAGIDREKAKQNVKEGKSVGYISTQIRKLKEKKNKIIDNAGGVDELNKKQQKNVDKIKDQIGNLTTARDRINDINLQQKKSNDKTDVGKKKAGELGVKFNTDVKNGIGQSVDAQGRLNSNINKGKNNTNNLLGKWGRMPGSIGSATSSQSGYNSKVNHGNTLMDILNRKAAKDANKKINVSDHGGVATINRKAGKSVSKGIKPYLTRSINSIIPKRTSIGIQPMLQGKRYAKGTDHHPGGTFMAGEKGYELGRLGTQWEMLNHGLYDRPSGYEVFPHDESKKILQSLNQIPGYANGARRSGEVDRITNQPNPFSDEPITIQLNITNSMDGKAVGKTVEKYVTAQQNRKQNRMREAPRLA